ncbi:MAG: mechanosensitive ion channel family protein [Eubacteriales bacterium]|nr:mechanosensitive ion channel family protein [Eubacteriales bacterium]
MEAFFSSLTAQAISGCSRIIAALVVLVVGRIIIRLIISLFSDSPLLNRTEGAVKTFSLSFINISLYILLTILIIGILGVPMASIAAVIASAGVAIGLAMQGSLSNLAGGIMLIIFKPFKLEDYIEACGITGTAKEINLFYTVLITPDNKRITIPNGTLMNAVITDYSAEEIRRIEMIFTCSRSENPAHVQNIMQDAMAKEEKILTLPEAPFARLTGSTNEAFEFTVRAWCKNPDYLELLYDLNQHITEALISSGIQAPSIHITTDAK